MMNANPLQQRIDDAEAHLAQARSALATLTPAQRSEVQAALDALAEDLRTMREPPPLFPWAEDEEVTGFTDDVLRTLVDALPIGVVVCDAEGDVRLTNAPGRSLLGGTVGGTVAAPEFAYTLHDMDGAPFPAEETPLYIAMQEDVPVEDVELLVRRADGEERVIVSSAVPLHADSGELIGGVVLFQDITQRKRMEDRQRQVLARVQESRQLAEDVSRTLGHERQILEIIMEYTPAHLAYLDPAFNFVRVNAAYAQAAGYTREELVGQNHFALFPDPENRAIFERVRDTGEPVTYHAKPFVYPQRPGEETYWDWTLVPVKGVEGQVVGLVLSLMDVTERQQARDLLGLYTDRLHILHKIDQAILSAQSVETIAAAAVAHVPRLVECIHVCVLQVNLDVGDMRVLGTYGDMKLNSEWRGGISSAWGGVFATLQRGETSIVTDPSLMRALLVPSIDAEEMQALVGVPLMVGDDLIGALCLGRETAGALSATESASMRELADQLAISLHHAHLYEQLERYAERLERSVARRTAALRASEARFRAIFENAALGIVLLDDEGRVITANAALQSLLECDILDLINVPWEQRVYPDDVEDARRLLDELFHGDRSYYRQELRFVREDERVVWGLWAASLVQGPGGAWFVIGLLEDITGRREAQEALVRAEKLALTGRLAASLAHEINNPLQTVIGCLGLAGESLEDEGGSEVRTFLAMGLEELKRAARIVAQLRDLNVRSEPDEGESIGIPELLTRVELLTQARCEGRHVTFTSHVDGDLPPVQGLPDRIQQVFLNLVLNAVDAMPNGGHLEVHASPTEVPPGVHVTFKDDGVGIPRDELPHLFDPFYTTKPDGLGLGLFITHNIVEEHGGYIEVESQEREGTQFTVWLPAAAEATEGE
jgi:PAS domain S-box-containing protein